MINVGKVDEDRLFRDEEDGLFEEEEVALYCFEVGFEAWVTGAAVVQWGHRVSGEGQVIKSSGCYKNEAYLWKLPVLVIFFPDRARNKLETTSKVGSS